MTIYAVANDILDWDLSSDARDDTGSFGGVEHNEFSSDTSTPGTGVTYTLDTPVTTDCWVHFRRNQRYDDSGFGAGVEFALYNDNLDYILRVNAPESSNPTFYIYDASGTVVETYSWSTVVNASPATMNTFDAQLDFTNNIFRFYSNSVLAFEVANLNHTGFGRFLSQAGDDRQSPENFTSEFICASFSTIGARVKTLTFGAPTTNTLIGTPSDALDRVENGTFATYSVAGLVGDADGEKVLAPIAETTYTPDAGNAVAAVKVKSFAQAAADSPVQNISNSVVVGATEYAQPSHSLSPDNVSHSDILENSPATSAAWTTAEIQGLTAGFTFKT